MSATSLILKNYVVMVLWNVFANVNLKDVKGKTFPLHKMKLLVLHPKKFLIVILVLFILIDILLILFI